MSGHIIVTGGAGYIGSHVCVALIEAGHEVTIIDNFANSHPEVLNRIKKITGRSANLIEADLADEKKISEICDALAPNVTGAIHLAGLKAVGESVANPGLYYQVNVNSTLNLLKIMETIACTRLVFSSSATVYGDQNKNPIKETGAELSPLNPYGCTKLYNENILKAAQSSNPDLKIVNLRYFNPVGAHPSGEIGEEPQGIPNNLFPYIVQVMVGRREHLKIFGADYETKDGTGVRDYIHVQDLARGHLAALEYLSTNTQSDVFDINLGAGEGASVKDVIHAFEAASGITVPFQISARRDGDAAAIFVDVQQAKKILNWSAEKKLSEMCHDHWQWQKNNPQGFVS